MQVSAIILQLKKPEVHLWVEHFLTNQMLQKYSISIIYLSFFVQLTGHTQPKGSHSLLELTYVREFLPRWNAQA